ncbi:hypothetical protein CEXT_642041 [Caerostris extrusa]|uniref:Uncharacterized protein n=1 Tax=Caerostris extrusa TaxID=172846 RepID=A0AAV4Q7J0_CAEEX|nr:hypothetical protein CEXT_642041 [Caerostris extrusa]
MSKNIYHAYPPQNHIDTLSYSLTFREKEGRWMIQICYQCRNLSYFNPSVDLRPVLEIDNRLSQLRCGLRTTFDVHQPLFTLLGMWRCTQPA